MRMETTRFGHRLLIVDSLKPPLLSKNWAVAKNNCLQAGMQAGVWCIGAGPHLQDVPALCFYLVQPLLTTRQSRRNIGKLALQSRRALVKGCSRPQCLRSDN